MGYLHPPPGDAPVIVMKDVGGDVREYSAQTTAYIRSGREVRLHECRSACTLALAAPNVCVFPDSVLRFHKAYNPITKATNEEVSSAMMTAYPPAVRERLGVLTRQYKSLTGSELIRLGVRDCRAPGQPRILVARASPAPGPAENPLSNAFGGLLSGLGSTQIPAYGGYGAPVAVQRVKVQVAEAKIPAVPPPSEGSPRSDISMSDAAVVMPAPPPRPADVAPAPPQTARNDAASPAPAVDPTSSPPTPPFRPLAPPAPATFKVSRWGLPINGSSPALVSARFAPFPYRLTRKS
jgi:hypothetical protein